MSSDFLMCPTKIKVLNYSQPWIYNKRWNCFPSAPYHSILQRLFSLLQFLDQLSLRLTVCVQRSHVISQHVHLLSDLFLDLISFNALRKGKKLNECFPCISYGTSWENLIKRQEMFPLVAISLFS